MDYSKEQFPLNHFALYCKGWYEPLDKSEDLFEFVSKILYMDGYRFAKTKTDVLNILLAEMDRYNSWMIENKNHYLKFQSFYIQKEQYKQWPYNLNDDVATLKVIISFISQRSKSEIRLSKPIYNRKLFKNGIIYDHGGKIGMTYKEKNNIVSKIFDR